jgi:catechol 2,3-dioxygenase-like lactoylglutathione lyase family enzyme
LCSGQRLVQVAYAVADVKESAARHSRLHGSGPFFAMEHVPIHNSWYRGKLTPFDPSVALGWSGEVMIEFLADNGSGPSVVHDLYPYQSGRSGLHHLCYFVDSFSEALASFENAGFPLAYQNRMTGGTDCAMVDAIAQYGHFIEFYERTEEMAGLYDLIRAAHQAFDGRDPVRSMELFIK